VEGTGSLALEVHMIPSMVEEHLRQRHHGFEHHLHRAAMTAQELAQAEHVKGRRVAKPVILRLGGELAIAVVAASDKVSLSALEEATGRPAELALESEFEGRFTPCEVGAEPPLAVFGLPIFVDAKLESEPRLVMPGGTHRDAVVLETREWMTCEGVQPVANLGVHM
jgi:Ala-tRNA(Pro) deacylase